MNGALLVFLGCISGLVWFVLHFGESDETEYDPRDVAFRDSDDYLVGGPDDEVVRVKRPKSKMKRTKRSKR